MVALALLVALGLGGLSGAIANGHSSLHEFGSLIGPFISGSFLVLIGLINLAGLVGIVRAFMRLRSVSR